MVFGISDNPTKPEGDELPPDDWFEEPSIAALPPEETSE
jgi:hypothetical protein